MKQILLLICIETNTILLIRTDTNITACKKRNKYYCLLEQILILLLVRIEANITACKKEKTFTAF